ncbi:hypothetical protein H6P81_010763 [Aristolochia fimbriata]|uniref:BHLH domain-containing protein n=1 Tax=Aristolochia fimbriata TaxID=158543 RepID=A0AAV7EU41_ARIFI|nr:hypothetical protein H6P81_010763 [Aristolochia fimbriata]
MKEAGGLIMEDLEGFLMEDEAGLIDEGPDHCLEASLNSTILDGWLDNIALPEVDVIGINMSPTIVPDQEDGSPNVNLDSFLSDTSFEEQIVYQANPSTQQQWGREEAREEKEDQLFDEKDDEEDEVESDDRKSCGSSKNVVSERNRRKRLNQQLFTLRSLVPNITKMDKRSILVDALAYLQSILQQTEAEMKMFDCDHLNPPEEEVPIVIDQSPPEQYTECNSRPAIPTISKIDAEMLGENRFVLKVTSNKAIGALGQVQKVIESLGLDITFVSVNELDRDHCLTMTFLQARKKGVVTEEKVKHRVRVLAEKMGFHLYLGTLN